jgi:Tfp pilus assembly protein PilF
VNTAWGELFLEKYDRKEAMRSFQDALKADESYVPAILGVARVAAEENPPAAKQAIERALKINPNSVPAHLLAAEMALDDRKRDDARDSAQRALKVNPNSLEHARSWRRSTSSKARPRVRLTGPADSEDQPGLRRGVPRRWRSPRSQLPLR